MKEEVKAVEEVASEVVQPTAMMDVAKLSISDLEEILEMKRNELGKGIKQSDEQVLPPGKAPTGFVWVYNRGPEKFEWQHNSAVYDIEGHSFGLFPKRVAEHGRTRSLLTVDTMTNVANHQLALPDDPTYGKPLKRISRIEVIDRRTNSDPAQLGSSERTHIAVLSVEGNELVMSRREGNFSELS